MKERLKHGQFRIWLEVETDSDPRSAAHICGAVDRTERQPEIYPGPTRPRVYPGDVGHLRPLDARGVPGDGGKAELDMQVFGAGR